MSDQAHRGARPSGPLGRSPDRRVLDLDDALRTVEAASGVLPQYSFARDPLRAAQAAGHALGSPGKTVVGMVVHGVPHLNWYKVQAGGLGWLPCCAASPSGLVPLGPREVGVYPPGSLVLVHLPDRLGHGIILGALPPALRDPGAACPDWFTQAGGSGLWREEAHKFPVKSAYQEGGTIDWSANRPADETAFLRGWISATGLRIGLTDFQLQAAVNEMCGLFASYLDSHLRLAGVQLDVESAVHGEYARDDEGEARLFRGVATYPWEALGEYAPGADFTAESPDAAVMYDGPAAKLDAAPADRQPFYRYVEYGGYLGQGHLRAVVAPAAPAGPRRYGQGAADPGVFRETVGLDGSYSLTSAKMVHIGKRCVVTVPKELCPPEDAGGDDAAADDGLGNYKFSGVHGAGADHKVGCPTVPDEAAPKSMFRAAAVADVIAHLVNWRALHPFHYHAKDFLTPQEADGPVGRAQEPLDFTALADQAFLPDPEPKTLRIDARYGDVEYFERESFLVFHDDGTVQLGGGGGEQLVLGGGRVRVEAPGGIDLLPGTDLVALADQIVLRARRAVDVSASEHDVRIKARKHVHVLAGNDGQDGHVLIESRGVAREYDYEGKFGEDVTGGGVVVKAANGQVGVLGQDIYLRTGGGLGDGDIVLDAGKGRRKVRLYADKVDLFAQTEVVVNFGPQDETSTVDGVYVFAKDRCVVDATLYLGGKLYGYKDAGIVIDGPIQATGTIATSGSLAARTEAVTKTDPGFAGTVTATLGPATAVVDGYKRQGETDHQQAYVRDYYQDNRLGSDAVVRNLGFSFRDPPGGDQYRTGQLVWPETRWQAMARLGGASGGTAWTEDPVTAQGEQTYPWPGRRKWAEEPVFLQIDQLTMFDPAAGVAAARPGPYEDPQLGSWEPQTMEAGYKLIR